MRKENNNLYGMGPNSVGELNGEHKSDAENMNKIQKLEKPKDCIGKIKKIYANNSRTAIWMENGEIWYWGGITYKSRNKREKIEGYKCLNKEPDIIELKKRGEKIIEYTNGLAHEVILTEYRI